MGCLYPAKSETEVLFPDFFLKGSTATIEISKDTLNRNWLVNGKVPEFEKENGKLLVNFKVGDEKTLTLSNGSLTFEKQINPIPLWLSLVPPLIAILMALFLKEVISSLFIGLLSGAWILAIYQNGISGIFTGFLATAESYILPALANKDHMSVVLFSMFIGATVSIISRNGGMLGIVNKLSKYANNSTSGQFITYILGLLIFFDDYANTLVVGNTMRPVMDRLRVSREKLAYLVDSTAAPVAAIAFVTTWIGAELGYIQDGIDSIPDLNENPYTVFLSSLKYSFYPILSLVFMGMLIYQRKDYGSMYAIEINARKQGRLTKSADQSAHLDSELSKFEAKKGIKPNWINAGIPIAIIIIGTIAGLIFTGYDEALVAETQGSYFKKLSAIIGNADSYKSLLWSSLTAMIVAFLLSLNGKKMRLQETIETMVSGFTSMFTAISILVLAWSLAAVTENLKTAEFITQTLLSFNIQPWIIPLLTFITAALVSFSTGTSWGTMAIIYPLMLPAAWLVCKNSGMSYEESIAIFHNTASCVLAGAVMGDHCSPISDTTILSSLASGCNHLSHVKTQIPYAISVGLVSMILGTVATGLGMNPFISFAMGIIVLYLIIWKLGKKVPEYLEDKQTSIADSSEPR